MGSKFSKKKFKKDNEIIEIDNFENLNEIPVESLDEYNYYQEYF
jgi:hypothetical protein